MIRQLKWVLVLLAWAVFIFVGFVLLERSDYGGGDFHLYYHAAHDYMPDSMPYFTVTGGLLGTVPYPPLLAQLLIPLARTFDIIWATRIWFAISVAAWLSLLAVLARFLPPEQRFTYWLLAACFVPVFEALRIGQVTVFLLVLIGFAWVAVKKDRPALAGLLIALAAWIKIYPALILVYFLWKRNWRAFWGGVIGGIGLALFQIAISGIGIFIDFFRSLLVTAGEGGAYHMWKNNSILGFASKLFQTNMRVEPFLVNPTLFTLTRLGLSLLVVAVLLFLTLRSKPHRGSLRSDDRFDLEYALAVLTMLLLSPWMYTDSMSPVFITFFILWYRGGGLRINLCLLVAGVLIFANYLLIWQPGDAFNALLLSLGFYALALIWVINVVLLARDRQTDHAAVALTSETA